MWIELGLFEFTFVYEDGGLSPWCLSRCYGSDLTISSRVLGVFPGPSGKFGPRENIALNSNMSEFFFSSIMLQLILWSSIMPWVYLYTNLFACGLDHHELKEGRWSGPSHSR